MKKEQDDRTGSAELRRRAEARLIEKRKDRPEAAEGRVSPVKKARLIQELQIHRIELEMQNEALKQAREEAEAERKRYLDLYDDAPVGYFTLGADGVIRQVNLTGANLLGAARSELVNRRFCHFVSEADVPACNAFLEKVFAGGREKSSCALAMGRKGRPLFDADIEAVAARDGRECRAVVRDVTERKKAEGEVRRLHEELERRVVERTAQLEAANKELEAFCYSVSHDLQTPLRAIDGYARMILRNEGDRFDEDVTRKFNIIRGSIQKMGQLINDLLMFSRLGRKQLSVSEVDMDGLFKEAWEELKTVNPDRSMTLTIEGAPPAMGDRALIRQVVGNILANAVKFAKTRGTVVVVVEGHRNDNETVYAVKDNGVGFDMAYYDKLFGMFQRLHDPDVYEGTGVGLAIARRIVSRHGGRIWAEGAVGKGATFTFTLPNRKA